MTTPPLRPGHTYFLGFRGVTDASFSLTTATNGTPIAFASVLNYTNGYVTNTLPALSKLTYRVDVPAEARRWRHTVAGNNVVKWYLDQGTLPTLTAADPATGSAGGAAFNQSLYAATWPWIAAQMYFLTVTNTCQPSGFQPSTGWPELRHR